MADEKDKEEKPPRTKRTGPGSMGEVFVRWRKLATNMRAYLPDMPQVAADHTRLEVLLNQIEAAFSEQEVLAVRTRELIELRRDYMLEARDVRYRLAANLQGHFGPYAERLREFAIKPRKRTIRRKPKPGEPEPEPEPTPEPAVTAI